MGYSARSTYGAPPRSPSPGSPLPSSRDSTKSFGSSASPSRSTKPRDLARGSEPLGVLDRTPRKLRPLLEDEGRRRPSTRRETKFSAAGVGNVLTTDLVTGETLPL